MTPDQPGGRIEPTRALWCDDGNHDFSERDPDMEVWARSRKVDGVKVTVPWTVCGPCLAGRTDSPGFNMKDRHAIMRGEVPGDNTP